MGFYDTIGGSQVKCFKYPTFRVDDKTIDIGAECGDFQFFKRGDLVPYRTRYYDLGENFMIFDIRRTFWGSSFEGLVHIVENGRYVTSEHYTRLSDSHPIYLVVDNYGKPLTIRTKEDFMKIIEEEVNSSIQYTEATKNYLMQMTAIPIMDFSNIKEEMKKHGWTKEFVLEQIEKNDAARAMAYEDVIEPFIKKWYDKKTELDIYGGVPVGLIYEVYKNSPNQYDWAGIIEKLEESAAQDNTSLMEQVEIYQIWAKNHLIKVEDDFYQLFPMAKGEH